MIDDESWVGMDDLPAPEVLQQKIIEHLEAALNSFRDDAAGPLTLSLGQFGSRVR